MPHRVDEADGEPGALLGGDTENQNVVTLIPLLTSIRSNSGACSMNSAYSAGVQKPITFSTPARLYHERSNNTISPPAGRWVM